MPNPFDKFKAKEGELTLGDVHPSIMLTTEEFREKYYDWVNEYGASLIDEEIEHLLLLIGGYHYSKQQNKTAARMNKKLSEAIQLGKRKNEMRVASSQAEAILSKLLGGDATIVATDKGKELAALLHDLIECPNEYIPNKAFELPANRKQIEAYLLELGLIPKAKTDLYTIL